ncbi:hypothetical protein [Taibaiella koreensis]|nr:hypothetical protein [Taibaiella koreensis]
MNSKEWSLTKEKSKEAGLNQSRADPEKNEGSVIIRSSDGINYQSL